MLCGKTKEKLPVEKYGPVGQEGWFIVDRITNQYVEIYYCPQCGSELDKKGCSYKR